MAVERQSLLVFVAAIMVMLTARTAAPAADAWQPAKGPLMTEWAKDVSPEKALPEYPRPQMVRREWLNLNGLWEYAVADKAAGKPPAYDGKILVPFAIESALSGVMKPLGPGRRLWYRRQFTVPKEWAGRRVLLHFGAVDWEATVTLNGRPVGSHRGGYDAFSLDITAALKKDGPQDLAVSVWDPSDSAWQLHGKQALRPAGCSYTACSGIWQTVWIEPVAATFIEGLKMVPDVDAGILRVTVTGRLLVDPLRIEATALDGQTKVASARGQAGLDISPAVRKNKVDFYHCESSGFSTDIVLPMKNARRWSPDDPFLYDLALELKDAAGKTLDSVQGYFGMRTIAVGKDDKGNTRALLNGKVLIMPGALDQGYWPDGLYTAPTDAALRYDIEAARKLGLIAVRKHVKTEPERWYYWTDRLGLLVLQDMPTGNEGDAKTDLARSPEASMQCEMEKRLLIRQLGNHPSIIMWILFNEGWGQHDTLRYARWAKDLDPARLIDEASGFPWHGGGDVVDTHGGIPPKDDKRLGITSEDGGWGVAAAGHCWSDKSWTYTTYDPETGASAPGLLGQGKTRKLPPLDDDSRRWMTQRVRGLFRSLWANKDRTGQSGDFYCQIVDVEDECNGLLSYDRAVFKVDPDVVRAACRGEEMAGKVVDLLPCAVAGPVTWRYTTARPAGDWFAPAFDDASWKEGAAGFGAGIAGVRTPWTTSAIWLRKEFTLAEKPAGPLLRMFHDEDVEVYLNGVLACRETGFLTSYDYFDIDATAAATLKPGKNVIAVHCRQTSGGQFIDVGIVVPQRADPGDSKKEPRAAR
jgi:hypothetical protein